MSLKLGIIGYGNMASGWHAKIPTQLPEVDLVAVHDIDPERVAAARADGYRAYDSLGDSGDGGGEERDGGKAGHAERPGLGGDDGGIIPHGQGADRAPQPQVGFGLPNGQKDH